MLVRVKMVGTGKDDDAHRPGLPTHRELITLTDQGIVYALIPDDDHPDLLSHPSAKTEQTGHGAALIALDADGHAAWYKHLDARYPERAGEFRPEVV